jgi:hypothetical protein
MCKYCEGTIKEKKDMYNIDCESEMDGRIEIDPDEKRLYATITTWHKERSFDYYSPDELVEEETLLIFDADYCPMCGRKLGE